MVKAKSKTKTIRVPSGYLTPSGGLYSRRVFTRCVDVPCQWLGKWVAVNNNHYGFGDGRVEIVRDEYRITHLKTGYAISSVFEEVSLDKVKSMAKKLDALGAGCWDFVQINTPKTKRWITRYKPVVFKILGKDLDNES